MPRYGELKRDFEKADAKKTNERQTSPKPIIKVFSFLFFFVTFFFSFLFYKKEKRKRK